MTNNYVGNVVPAPGFGTGPSLVDAEILASNVRFTQRGVTLAAGQGVLTGGTILGQVTGTKLWARYDKDNRDGSEIPRGVLRQSVDTGGDPNGGRFLGNIVISGILKLDLMSGVDSTSVTTLSARTDAVLNTFTF